MATSNSIARKRRVARSGRPIDLGPTEYRLLEFFLEHPGRVFSREQMLDSVWGRDIYIDERTVDVHIGRLRKAAQPRPRAGPDPHRARRRLRAG
jgi:two-component system phosphate regulon response regulator PhoB